MALDQDAGDSFEPKMHLSILRPPGKRDVTAALFLPQSVPSSDRAIEIRLPNGIVIGVGEMVTVEPLRRVLAALTGR
jgi:hypothetical protein